MIVIGGSQEPITAAEKYSRGTLQGSVCQQTSDMHDGPKPRPAKACRRPFHRATTGSGTPLTLLLAVDTSCLRKAPAPRGDLARATIAMRMRVSDSAAPRSARDRAKPPQSPGRCRSGRSDAPAPTRFASRKPRAPLASPHRKTFQNGPRRRQSDTGMTLSPSLFACVNFHTQNTSP